MQLIWCLLSNYLNMFRASLCPSSGEQECALPHMVFCTGSDGCGCVKLGRKLCALWRLLLHTLVLLMMGIMMPETCWDKSLIINIRLVASFWLLSLHPTFMMHGHKSLKNSVLMLPDGSVDLGHWCMTSGIAVFHFSWHVIAIGRMSHTLAFLRFLYHVNRSAAHRYSV